MKKVFVICMLFGAFIYYSNAAKSSCGCAPGRQGASGQPGYYGAKGERGDIGDPGIRGNQGGFGFRGAKGIIGDRGRPGREPNYWEPTYPGPRGPQGPPGICGCGIRPIIRNDSPGNYYITDNTGNLNFVGQDYPIQNDFIQKLMYANKYTTTTTTTTARPPAPSPYIDHSNLYMLGPNGQLIPVSNIKPYDLFAAHKPYPTTTTTTTTKSPIVSNEKIYILGPKGTLIPIDSLGIKSPHLFSYGHKDSPSYGGSYETYKPHEIHDSIHGSKIFGHKTSPSHGSYETYKPPHETHGSIFGSKVSTSSYNKWLRGMLMGEIDPEDDDAVPFAHEMESEEEEAAAAEEAFQLHKQQLQQEEQEQQQQHELEYEPQLHKVQEQEQEHEQEQEQENEPQHEQNHEQEHEHQQEHEQEHYVSSNEEEEIRNFKNVNDSKEDRRVVVRI